MQDFTVAGAVLEAPEGILLVCNRRRDGSLDWSPPGGVIDPGEDVLTGLTREVLEETGIAVTEWGTTLYDVVIEAPGLGWCLRATVRQARSWHGDLHVDDPDGVVIDAAFVGFDEAAARLAQGHPWVGEPLAEWLEGRWDLPRSFGYHVAGEVRSSVVVTRVDPG